jgi:hypothetical protein
VKIKKARPAPVLPFRMGDPGFSPGADFRAATGRDVLIVSGVIGSFT